MGRHAAEKRPRRHRSLEKRMTAIPLGKNNDENTDRRSSAGTVYGRAAVMRIAASAFLAMALFTAPLANADPCNNQACLQKSFAEAGGPFIGSWGAHGEGVTVNADGSGVETTRRGTLNFQLNSVQTSTTPWDTAYGGVEKRILQRGAFVTIQLVDAPRQRHELQRRRRGIPGFPVLQDRQRQQG